MSSMYDTRIATGTTGYSHFILGWLHQILRQGDRFPQASQTTHVSAISSRCGYFESFEEWHGYTSVRRRFKLSIPVLRRISCHVGLHNMQLSEPGTVQLRPDHRKCAYAVTALPSMRHQAGPHTYVEGGDIECH
jgi:hypothetical protein